MMEALACHPLGKMILKPIITTLYSSACPDTVKVNMQLSSSPRNIKVGCLKIYSTVIQRARSLQDHYKSISSLSTSPGSTQRPD